MNDHEEPSDSQSKCGGHLDADPKHPTEECAQEGTPCCECGDTGHCCHTCGPNALATASDSTERGLNAYEQKQEDRRARLEAAAAKARGEADSRFGRARAIGSHIPFGQPILVGHHSERRHRRDLERIDDSMRKGIEAEKRAQEYERRAAGVGTGGISSDDPDAIKKLEEELADVEARQALMKRVNAAHKAFLKDPASLEAADFSDAVKERIRSYKPAYPWEPHPFAPYQLTNNGANARRIRDRIKQLQAKRATPAQPEREVNGVRVVDNAEANRLQMFFPGKPSDDVRTRLKRAGFRWTPSLGCWQAFRSRRASWAAEGILGVPSQPADGESAETKPTSGGA